MSVDVRKAFVSLLLCLCLPLSAAATERLRLATTTSTENSGLLRVLIPPFEKANDCRVDVIAVGTGKALKLGEAGDVDILLVHARSREEAFVSAGYGVSRHDVMYNDFVIVGPADDPARIHTAANAADAARRIATSRATFISRGDQSGTHFKERAVWRSADTVPGGEWYLEAGQGMGNVLLMASEKQGYALSDRGTYLALKDKLDLQVLFEGDSTLFNPYGVIAVSPVRHPHVNYPLAVAFVDFLLSADVQTRMAGFRKHGHQLFHPYGAR